MCALATGFISANMRLSRYENRYWCDGTSLKKRKSSLRSADNRVTANPPVIGLGGDGMQSPVKPALLRGTPGR